MADRIEREIEDILKKIDNFVPEKPRRATRRAGQPLSAAQGWLARRLARVSLNQVMMWSLLVVLISFFVRGVPGVSWLMIGALIVFATAFLLSRRGGGRTAYTEKRWRGQALDLSGQPLPDRIKAWLKGRRRR